MILVDTTDLTKSHPELRIVFYRIDEKFLRSERTVMNGKVCGREVVVAKFKMHSRHFDRWTEENQKHAGHSSLYPGCESNLGPP
jgi:hypothetical protein